MMGYAAIVNLIRLINKQQEMKQLKAITGGRNVAWQAETDQLQLK